MKICFTLDDGLKSQMQFWNRTVIPATYFILPFSASFAFSREEGKGFCGWSDIRALAKSNEIGFHEYYITERMDNDVVDSGIRFQQMLFKQEVGFIPKTFAYSDMRPIKLGIIQKHFSYVRDYFWRDKKEDKYEFRIPDEQVPKEIKPYRDKIFCIHPIFDTVLLLKRLKEISEQYEYCIIILHEIGDREILMARTIKQVYDTLTFREIFNDSHS